MISVCVCVVETDSTNKKDRWLKTNVKTLVKCSFHPRMQRKLSECNGSEDLGYWKCIYFFRQDTNLLLMIPLLLYLLRFYFFIGIVLLFSNLSFGSPSNPM